MERPQWNVCCVLSCPIQVRIVKTHVSALGAHEGGKAPTGGLAHLAGWLLYRIGGVMVEA